MSHLDRKIRLAPSGEGSSQLPASKESGMSRHIRGCVNALRPRCYLAHHPHPFIVWRLQEILCVAQGWLLCIPRAVNLGPRHPRSSKNPCYSSFSTRLSQKGRDRMTRASLQISDRGGLNYAISQISPSLSTCNISLYPMSPPSTALRTLALPA